MSRLHPLSLCLCLISLSACGGAQVPSPELYEQLKVSPSKRFKGTLDTSKLTPRAAVEGELDLDSLGRELKPAQAEGRYTLLPPSPCGKLIPAKRVRQDYRDRLSEVFDEHLLMARGPEQSTLTFPQIGFTTALKPKSSPSELISAYLGLDRVLAFVDLKELRYFNRCCELTGSCGERMVSTLYEVKRGVHYLPRTDPNLAKTLLAFERAHGDTLNAQRRKSLALKVYQDQIKSSPRAESAVISHIEHKLLPKASPSPFTQVTLTVTPSKTIRCKKKKAKKTSAVEFTIQIGGVNGAEELLGYEITTSNKWVDLSLVKHNPRVRVGTGKIGCVPGEEAFTNYEHACPKEIMLMAFPPACSEVKGKGAGNFTWRAEVSVFAPGELERTYHSAKSDTVTTPVKTR